MPAHLQDLREGDLPEEQRVVVLDQIAIFRENAARREREKKIMDDEKEKFKAMEAARNASAPGAGRTPSSGGENYGYGNRAFTRGPQAPQRQWGAVHQPSPQQQQSPQQNGNDQRRPSPRDPQGYSEPVAFVRPQTAEAKGESERTDEEEEDIRRQRRDRERDAALRDVSLFETPLLTIPTARTSSGKPGAAKDRGSQSRNGASEAATGSRRSQSKATPKHTGRLG